MKENTTKNSVGPDLILSGVFFHHVQMSLTIITFITFKQGALAVAAVTDTSIPTWWLRRTVVVLFLPGARSPQAYYIIFYYCCFIIVILLLLFYYFIIYLCSGSWCEGHPRAVCVKDIFSSHSLGHFFFSLGAVTATSIPTWCSDSVLNCHPRHMFKSSWSHSWFSSASILNCHPRHIFAC